MELLIVVVKLTTVFFFPYHIEQEKPTGSVCVLHRSKYSWPSQSNHVMIGHYMINWKTGRSER